MGKMLRHHLMLISVLLGLMLVSCTSNQDSTDSDSLSEQPLPIEYELEYLGNEVCIECHEDGLGELPNSTHWLAADPRSPGAHENGCEACHGPGEQHFEMDGDIDVPGMITFGANASVAAEQQNRMCLKCHQSDVRHWQGSLHDTDDIACTSCHTLLHGDQTQNRLREQTFCYDCHPNVRAETNRPFHHPIREELLFCTDCHNPHGSPGPAQLAQLSLNDNCYSCHAEKRGPFLWEHEPVIDDCNACHLPHGSIHPALLASRPPLLCQQCHQSTRINHARQGFYFGKPPVIHTSGGGPGLRTGPDQMSGSGMGPGDGTASAEGDGRYGDNQGDQGSIDAMDNQGGGGRNDDRDGFGPGDGTGTGEGGDSYGDGGHDDDAQSEGGDDQDQSQDQSQDQDQDQDQHHDQHHDQDRTREGPGSDSIVQGGSARFLQGNSCLGCHPQVHGSNHPSGVKLMR